MNANFQSLDAVFFSDCPICAVNLKTMWCEYACNPLKIDFRKCAPLQTNPLVVEYLGQAYSGGVLMSEVNFNIDSDYACGLFTSCKQESFIAIAGISSSIAFLDFLGVNGQNTSLSIITFNLTTDLSYPQTL
jgi:Niemann-Pick C1 N terminus